MATDYQPPNPAFAVPNTSGKVVAINQGKPWVHSNLFGCMSSGNMGICCYGFWCQPCLFGENADKVMGGGCCGHCCIYWLLTAFCAHGCYAMGIRREIRNRNGLQGEDCHACLAETFCDSCAVCQDAREIKAHGMGHTQFVVVTQAPPQQTMVA